MLACLVVGGGNWGDVHPAGSLVELHLAVLQSKKSPITARADILASDEFAQAVREREQFYLSHGIHSVPAVIINDRHLISGGQPAAVFEQALRQIAAEQVE